MFRQLSGGRPSKGTKAIDIKAHEGLVRKLVGQRMRRMGMQPGSRKDLADDLHQEGMIAVWRASQKYDSRRGKFSTLAHRHVDGALGRALKKQGVISVGERAIRKGVRRPDLAPLGAVDDPMERRSSAGGIGGAEARLDLARIKRRVGGRDWKVLAGSAEHSQAELARKLGISKTRVNQVLKEARRKAG